MSSLEVYQWLVETQGFLGSSGVGGGVYSCSSNCSYFIDGQPGCPGSSFTAMGAAFATQGYFAQADLIWQLTNTNMGLWAPLLYILAALGGMISLAMGMPPRMYLWFFMGPAIYQFLLGTTLPAYGTSWCIANFAQDQTEVWKLAEVGLRNSNVVARSRGSTSTTGPIEVSQYDQPSNPVEVSYFFLWFDGVISSTVQWMTVWTGVYHQQGGEGRSSGIIEAPVGTDYITNDQYYLMSNLKWSMLDRITSARLHNGDVRDAFVTFMSSECGDALARVVDPGLLIAASNSKTGQLPDSIFRGVTATSSSSGTSGLGGSTSGGSCRARTTRRDYLPVTKAMTNRLVPLPRSIRRSWWNPDRAAGAGPIGAGAESLRGTLPGFYQGQSYTYTQPTIPSLGGFLGGLFSGGLLGGGSTFFRSGTENADKAINGYLEVEDNISCADYLFYVMNAFRWEAGNIYYQLVSTAPRNMSDEHVVYNLLYGWDLKDECGEKLSGEKLQNFVQDLILLHLIRNEMALAPKVADSRFMQQGAAAGNASNRYIAETGAKAKFGEVYSWALMIPYIQGVLLYLLALAYPFVCIMIVVPGWHKTLFTWMAFWTWVKLWDLGFAIVLVLERSIWAAMGNSSVAANLSQKVSEMQQWGKIVVSQCSRESGGTCPTVPEVVDGMTGTGQQMWNNLLAILDRSMMVGSSIDFDIQNGYYIYIMSALYFAVPAVTGQLVLGAKAGAAGMVSNLTQGAQSDGGRAASQAFTGNLRNQAAAASAAVGQENYAKAMRQQGLAAQALAAGNEAMDQGLLQGANSAMSQNIGAQSQAMGYGVARTQAALGLASAFSQQKIAFASNPAAQRLFANRNGYADAGAWASQKNAPGLSDAQRKAEGENEGFVSELMKGGGGSTEASPVSGLSSGGTSAGPTGMLPMGGGPTGSIKGMANGINSLSKVPGMVNGYAATWVTPQAMVGMSQAAANESIAAWQNQAQAGIAAQQANFNVAGFGFSSAQNGLGVAERRMGSQAEFGAQSAAFDGRRDYANSTAGYLSALGVDAGVVGPGNKPTDMTGMAMTGMLGSRVQSLANYATPGSGGFWSNRSDAMGNLSQNYSGAQVMGAYQQYAWGMQQAATYGDTKANEVQAAWASPVAPK